MKESKFIELLNLYIDQQISPEDAASLEEAILQNPQRRQIYRQYCRMHRACKIVLDRGESENGSESIAGSVVAFAAPPRSHRGYYAAGVAAAACIALVAVLSLVRSGGSAPSRVMAAVPALPTALAKSTLPAAMAPVRMQTPATNLFPTTEGVVARQMPATRTVNWTSDRFVFAGTDMDSVRLFFPARSTSALRPPARPSIEDFVFTPDAAAPETPKIFRSHQPGDESEGNMAIEFQR